MATQAWQMPDVDAEKYQSVTKQGYNPQNHPNNFSKRNGSVFFGLSKRNGSV